MSGKGDAGMEKRENQRVMLTKRLIKESLTRLLAAESIHRVSIRTLCEDAGINRSTFYKYYGSQYDVLAEIEDDLIGSIRDALDDGDNAPEAAGRKIGAICSYLQRNMAFVQLLVGNNMDPDFPDRLFSLPQIKQFMMERLAERYDEETCGYIYTFFISGCYRVVQDWLSADRRKPFEEIAMLMLELIEKICG